MYPEGGFPHHLRKINDRFAKKNNLPELKHTLLPRVGAMKTIIDVLAPKDGKRYLDYVVDITLGHEIENPYIVACMTMRRKNRFGFLYRVYKVDDVSFCCSSVLAIICKFIFINSNFLFLLIA